MVVVDCGLGNIHSLLGCLRRLAPGDRIEFTADPALIEEAACVLLPGDGAFGAYMDEIDQRGLRETLVAAASTKPFFGICVGMQVLHESSEEGESQGLGVLPGRVLRFPVATGAKIPLMGWLDVDVAESSHPLAAGLAAGTRYYFLHSYYVPDEGDHVLLRARHTKPFAAAVARDGLFATQFHPEKSAAAGIGLLAAFLERVN